MFANLVLFPTCIGALYPYDINMFYWCMSYNYYDVIRPYLFMTFFYQYEALISCEYDISKQ